MSAARCSARRRATYSTADGGQSLILGSGTAAGLTVSREVTVPDTGSQDFARTVDTFTNSTGSSITTTVQIVANLGSERGHHGLCHLRRRPTVDPGDQWIGTDGGGTPAVITYIHGPLSLQPTSVSLSGDDLHGPTTSRWPPGQTVSLAYFTIVATTPAAAVAAANALVGSSGFGGQAGAFLSASELQSLANFANPSPVLTPPPSPTEGAALSNVNPLPLQRHQRQREHRQLHGHDHLGRRHILDRDQHARQRRPDRRRSQRRLRRSRLARLHGSDAQPRHPQRPGHQRRGHDRCQRPEFHRARRAADGRRLDAAGGHRIGGLQRRARSSTSATPIPTRRPPTFRPSSPGATATPRR